METLQNMVHDERTYLESVGKYDRQTVMEALADKGANTVLRVCFGLNGKGLPVRALGYQASASALQEDYFPEAQVQFVFPVYATEQACGVNPTDSRTAIRNFTSYKITEAALPMYFKTGSPFRQKHGSYIDKDVASDELRKATGEITQKVIEDKPNSVFAKMFKRPGASDLLAAHLLMHETDPELTGLEYADDRIRKPAERVITLSPQAERPFYVARILCRQAGLISEDQGRAAGQLFSRHIRTPSIASHDGEPMTVEELTDEAIAEHPSLSIQRDLTYLKQAMHENQARYMQETETYTAYSCGSGMRTFRRFRDPLEILD